MNCARVPRIRFFRFIVPCVCLLGIALTQKAADGAQMLPGQIMIDPDHPQWLKCHGGGHVFICGPGDPEDFLYRGARKADGTRAGDQVALIDKLIQHGGNCIYLQIVRSHGGDAKSDTTQNPFIDSDPARGLDSRILDQWEQWFTRMDQNGILIYLFLYDDGARIWNTGDVVGPEERALVEGIVRRFRHHRNLIWVVAEESEERYSPARVRALAETIRQADGHDHLIGNHHHTGTTFKVWQPGGALRHYSMQLNASGEAVHAGAVEAWEKAAGRYQVIYSENTAIPEDADGKRRQAWAIAMGGLMPMLIRVDIASTPPELLAQCRYLQRFFEATDFPTMAPHDALADAGTRYVMAAPGRSYIAYADTAVPALGLKGLPAGRCEVTWLDCQTGRTIPETHRFASAGNRVFPRPAGLGPECAAWIRFPEAGPAKVAPARPPPSVAAPQTSGNRPPRVQDLNVTVRADTPTYVQLRFTDEDGPGPYTYRLVEAPRHGVLTGDDNDRTYTPNAGYAGSDGFSWRVHDGAVDSAVATVTLVVGRAVGAARPQGAYFPPPESQGGWRKLDQPDDLRRLAGMAPAKLAELAGWLRASDQCNFAAVVIRRGYVVLEVERGNSARTDARRVASVSKAVCATVLAIAAERSQQGLTPHRLAFDDPAFRFIPWAQPLSDPRKARITVRQLLNHTSGIAPEAVGAPNDGTWEYVLGHTGDARTARLAFDPGTGCGYSTHALHHASLVCEYVTGQPYDRFAIEHFFQPIGCEHWWFQSFAGGEPIGRHPTHGLGMPARDLARIGYCLLRGGRWHRRQVVPSWFVDGVAAPRSLTGVKEMRWGYDSARFVDGWEQPNVPAAGTPRLDGIPADARFKPGSGGQLIGFVRSLDLVVTRQTGASGKWEYEEYLRRACAAVLE